MRFFGKIIIAVLIIAVIVVVLRTHKNKSQHEVATETSSEVQQEVVIKSDVDPGVYRASITHDAMERTYTVHIPEGYSGAVQHPLVFLLHGGGGNGGHILASTDLGSKADAEGFIVVSPDGVDGNWNDGRAAMATGNDVSAINDVDFLLTLLEEMKAAYNVDAQRVYSTGVSNGAQMSQRLACDTTGVFAAIGPVSGAFRNELADSCPDPNSIPVVGIHGTEDPFVPIYDADGIPALPTILERRGVNQEPITEAELASFWVEANQCGVGPDIEQWPDLSGDGTVVSEHTYSGCTNGNSVVYYIVEGAGHGWPPGGSALEELAGGSSENIIANDVIWEFFSEYSL